MDERLFWRTMNPARLHALFNARFAAGHDSAAAADPPRSLSEYLMGG